MKFLRIGKQSKPEETTSQESEGQQSKQQETKPQQQQQTKPQQQQQQTKPQQQQQQQTKQHPRQQQQESRQPGQQQEPRQPQQQQEARQPQQQQEARQQPQQEPWQQQQQQQGARRKTQQQQRESRQQPWQQEEQQESRQQPWRQEQQGARQQPHQHQQEAWPTQQQQRQQDSRQQQQQQQRGRQYQQGDQKQPYQEQRSQFTPPQQYQQRQHDDQHIGQPTQASPWQTQRQQTPSQQPPSQQPPSQQPPSAWQRPPQQPPSQQPPSAWQRPQQQAQPVPQQFSHSPQQQQVSGHQQGAQSRGRGKGRGQPGPNYRMGKEFSPPAQQMQAPQQWGRGEATPREPPSIGGDASAGGDRRQASRETEKGVTEITSSVQEMSMSRRPMPGGGDAPSSIIPQTSSDARRGGKDAKLVTRVITNFFPLNIGKIETAIHYDVAIDPDKPKKLLRPVMEEFRRKRYPSRYPAYDGSKNLYSSSPLFESTEISDTVKVMEDEREKEFHVTVKFATKVDLTCLRNYTKNVSGRSALELDKPMQALQCVDIVLRSAPALSCIPVGRSYFTRPQNPYTLGDGAVLYNGFFQAAILGWKPFVNIDVANKAFPAALNMLDLLKEMGTDLNYEPERRSLDSINRHMKTLKIQYELPRNQASRRVYRVNELGPPSNKATFKEDTGRTLTVSEYFKTKKNILLKYPHLPTLWVGSRNRENKILLPIEFCTILPDQVVNKKMTEAQTRTMIKQTATDTRTRLQKIQQSVAKANYNESPALREFGITVNPTPQEVEARVLHPPMLEYNNNKRETVFKGTWRPSQFIQGASLSDWTVLCLDRRTRDDVIRRLEQDLMKTARQLGMDMRPPASPTIINSDRTLRDDLRKYFAANRNFQMIIVILNHRSESYNYVKEASEIAVGCLTQCLKSNTVNRLSPSTVSNILLKINAKLNGVNHQLQGLNAFLAKPCMIMGADVTHPGPESKDFPSVAAVTASFDAQFFKYAFEWRLQPARQEMIEDLQEITRQHLLNFYRKNNRVKPEKIIYVRDGVSDGQFEQVLNVELTAIRTACVRLEPNYNPPIVFVVVQKRHHTRFFPKDPRISEDRNCNVPAGTCVDTEITHPSIIDFYLVSHASIQGVAKPTKYVKLWDDCNMSEDELEKLMYYLCHMFARCNRSVSYPAPTYYAHLAAARARVYCEIDRIDMRNLEKEQKRLTIKENISKGLPMFFV